MSHTPPFDPAHTVAPVATPPAPAAVQPTPPAPQAISAGSTDSPSGLGPNGRPLATFGDRALAYLIDSGLAFGLGIVLMTVSGILGGFGRMLGFLAWMAATIFVLAWLPGITGATPGKRLMGLSVVHKETGSLLGGPSHLMRVLIGHSLNGFLMLGWLWPLWDARNQTWADKIATSVVTKGDKGSFLPIFPDGNPF